MLDRVDVAALPGYLRNRVLMRRAGVWASLAYQRARQRRAAPTAAAQRALAALAGVDKAELTDDDAPTYSDAAMRVNASRWAAVPAPAAAGRKRPRIATVARGEPGETCIALVDAKRDAQRPLAQRCTYGIVWTGSATLNREGTALALAVQPTETWRELWVFRKAGNGWTVASLPPAAIAPDVGYAEFAGWVPGGTQMLVAREARGEGKYKRSFEVLRLDTLARRAAGERPERARRLPALAGPGVESQTLSLR